MWFCATIVTVFVKEEMVFQVWVRGISPCLIYSWQGAIIIISLNYNVLSVHLSANVPLESIKNF